MVQYNNIFLIDDDEVVNYVNARIITKLGIAHNIQAFENACEVLDTLKQQNNTFSTLPNLILLDINMPDMDGWEFLDKFEQLPAVMLLHNKVILLSSSIDPKDIERAKTYKTLHDFISKPLTIEKLIKVGLLI